MCTLRSSLSCLGAFRARARRRAWRAAPVLPSIPAPFNASQGHKVLELQRVGRETAAGAALLLQAWTPTHFSEAQAACVTQMLRLDPKALHATLADALEPGPLRDRLRAGASSAVAASSDSPLYTTTA